MLQAATVRNWNVFCHLAMSYKVPYGKLCLY